MGTGFLTQGSNKRAITLDLKQEAGREVLQRLVAGADVLVENYRPGAFEALGLGYEALAAINPRLVYCSISAFGQGGPRGEQTAYDHVIQATSGIMATTGTPEVNPIKFGAPAIDYATGTMGAFALAAALFQRERTGRGQRIDLAMLDVAMMMQASPPHRLSAHRQAAQAARATTAYATNSAYADQGRRAGDARRQQPAPAAAALGGGRPAGDGQGGQRGARRRPRRAKRRCSREIMLTRTADEWEAYLQARHVPAARVRTHGGGDGRPAPRRRAACCTAPRGAPGVDGAFGVPVAAFSLAHGGARVDTPPPRLGADTEAVLAELGYAPGDIAALRASGAV